MRADDIADLMQKIDLLSPEELKVLRRLRVERPVVAEEIASDLYDLPKNIYRAIDKLKDMLLVSTTSVERTQGQGVVLTDTGLKVQKILSVSGDNQVEASTPRYRG